MARVVHFEIHAENPQRAVDFYKNVFEWEFQKWEGPQDYWLITTGADDDPGINGGLMKRQGPPPKENQPVTSYACIVDVDDVDGFTNKVESNGGKIVVPKMAVPGVGWLVYGKDTEDNIFGMMQMDADAK